METQDGDVFDVLADRLMRMRLRHGEVLQLAQVVLPAPIPMPIVVPMPIVASIPAATAPACTAAPSTAAADHISDTAPPRAGGCHESI